MNRPGQIFARGDNYLSAVIFATLFDGVGKRFSIIGDAVANGPEILDT
jgi:hypothetical protein